MNLILDQPAGMGDIFFIQKMCDILSESNNVYLPVHDTSWVSGACRLISRAIIGSKRSVILPENNFRIIDLSNQPKTNGYIDTMTSKYDGVGIDWKDWAKYLKYKRIKEREDYIKNWYGIKDGEDFAIFNTFFASKPGMRSIDPEACPPIDPALKKVTINPNIVGSTVFDYCWLFENATEIHTVDTCYQYIIETLDTKADRLVVYPRYRFTTEKTIAKLFAKPWEWVNLKEDKWI